MSKRSPLRWVGGVICGGDPSRSSTTRMALPSAPARKRETGTSAPDAAAPTAVDGTVGKGGCVGFCPGFGMAWVGDPAREVGRFTAAGSGITLSGSVVGTGGGKAAADDGSEAKAGGGRISACSVDRACGDVGFCPGLGATGNAGSEDGGILSSDGPGDVAAEVSTSAVGVKTVWGVVV